MLLSGTLQLPLRVAATPRRRTWRDALVARKKSSRTVRLLRWPGRRGVAFTLGDEGVAATVATASAFNCRVPAKTKPATIPNQNALSKTSRLRHAQTILSPVHP